jgi:hypothetical protein
MAKTNIKLDKNFFIFALTQNLFAEFYLNLHPIFVMKFFISRIFTHPHPQLLSLSSLVHSLP